MSRLRSSEDHPKGSVNEQEAAHVPTMSPVGKAQKSASSGGAMVIDMSKSSPVDSVPLPREELRLLCFDISNVTRTSQFVLLSSAVIFFYLIYGYMQELIFKLEGFKPFGWYLTLVQFAYYSIFGFVELALNPDKRRRIPMRAYLLLAFLTVATMGLSNTSVGYLNYPTQVIFKCCKLIPVLIGGIFIQGKKYGVFDYLSCVCMSVGLILFTLADSSVSPNFNTYGIILISLALLADAVIGNVQEKTMKHFSATNSEVVLYSYSLGFVYILFGLVATSRFAPAFSFCLQYPVKTYGYALLFSVTGYIGVKLVLTMVKTFGALVAVTVTTCRKAITIILSFVFFTKPFTLQYVWSGVIVVIGIYLNVYSKNRESWNKYIIRLWGNIRSLYGRKELSPHKIDMGRIV